jgi:hypothetical protein
VVPPLRVFEPVFVADVLGQTTAPSDAPEAGAVVAEEAAVVAVPPELAAVVSLEELLPLLHAAKRSAALATDATPTNDRRTEFI